MIIWIANMTLIKMHSLTKLKSQQWPEQPVEHYIGGPRWDWNAVSESVLFCHTDDELVALNKCTKVKKIIIVLRPIQFDHQ